MKKLTMSIMAILFLAGCGAEAPNENSADNENITVASKWKEQKTVDEVSFDSMTSEQAEELIASENVYILDVRSEDGYSEGHIPNAKNIPLKELEGRLSELDKNNTFLIVCKTGKTSEEASKLLVKNSYLHIFNMTGGMDSWKGDIVTN
jgi:rhodanese-related sulfurtransferase